MTVVVWVTVEQREDACCSSNDMMLPIRGGLFRHAKDASTRLRAHQKLGAPWRPKTTAVHHADSLR